MKNLLLFSYLHAAAMATRFRIHDGHNCQSMALIKLGAFITEIRGKVGGTIFSKNKGGTYAKNRVMPANPQTAAQQNVRGFFGAIASLWRTLTAAQRELWNELAAEQTFNNSLGDATKISGLALFQKYNGNLNTVGSSVIESPKPLEGTTPISISAFSVSAAITDMENTLTVVALSTQVTNSKYAVFMTPSLSAGITNFHSRLRLIGTFADIAALNTANALRTPYIAKFGYPVIGSKVGLQIVPINSVTGESGVGVSDLVVVTEIE